MTRSEQAVIHAAWGVAGQFYALASSTVNLVPLLDALRTLDPEAFAELVNNGLAEAARRRGPPGP